MFRKKMLILFLEAGGYLYSAYRYYTWNFVQTINQSQNFESSMHLRPPSFYTNELDLELHGATTEFIPIVYTEVLNSFVAV